MSRRKKRRQGSKGWAPSPAQESVSPGSEGQGRSGGRWRIIALLASVALIVPIAAVVAFLVVGGSDEPAGPPRAAIVDQLSLTFPNAAFVEEATATLEEAGYVVDYIPGDEVTIDLYRGLPEGDYDYILLRVHTAQFDKEWRGRDYDEPVLFTSELYAPTLYVEEQWEVQLNPAYMYEGATKYFAIAANFIEQSMSGDFDDTTVIMMGCGGLQTDRTAEAFVSRGAETVVGWSDLVSASHTDAATQRLLEKLFLEELPMEAALAQTVAEIGPDPTYKSTLLSYSPEG